MNNKIKQDFSNPQGFCYDEEVWKSTYIFPDRYAISNKGNLKVLPYIKKTCNLGGYMEYTTKERAMSPTLDSSGYLQTSLSQDRSKKCVKIAKLVAMAFVEGYEDGKQVNHIDGNKTNNHFSNLEWVTPQENVRHSYDTGLACNKGVRHPRHVLNDEIVVKILDLYSQGNGPTSIAKCLGLNYHTVWKVVKRINWSHVEYEK